LPPYTSGEILEEVDGRSVSAESMEWVAGLLERAGAEYSLRVERDGEKREVTLRLESTGFGAAARDA
jgi:S1-C subfamily serine protease